MKETFFKKFSASLTLENVCRRVEWLVFLRWFAGVGVVIAVLAAKAFFGIDSIDLPLALGGGILFYNSIFEIIRRILARRRSDSPEAIRVRFLIINIQIFTDLVMLAALVYYTGGIANPFLFFFIFHMVISSIILSRPNAYGWAIFTIILETALFYLEHFQHIPHKTFFPWDTANLTENGFYVTTVLVAFSITLLICVYFATSIMRPIRQRQMELTELKNALEEQRDQLEEKNIELIEMDLSKTEFLYRVEHELKAPIGALQSLLSVISMDISTVSEDKKTELLSRAQNRVTMMKELVNDLLNLSRIDQRSFALELETLQLEDILNETIEDLGSYSRKKGIPVKTFIEAPLPEIRADKEAIQEILRNLVHNGIKYSFKGEVDVTMKPEPERIMMTVQDSGIGISEENLKDVFKEFYRTANAKAFEEGSGLGLSLVKRLIEKHGGSISVESQLNKGTTFTVIFPVTNSTIIPSA